MLHWARAEESRPPTPQRGPERGGVLRRGEILWITATGGDTQTAGVLDHSTGDVSEAHCGIAPDGNEEKYLLITLPLVSLFWYETLYGPDAIWILQYVSKMMYRYWRDGDERRRAGIFHTWKEAMGAPQRKLIDVWTRHFFLFASC